MIYFKKTLKSLTMGTSTLSIFIGSFVIKVKRLCTCNELIRTPFTYTRVVKFCFSLYLVYTRTKTSVTSHMDEKMTYMVAFVATLFVRGVF